MPASLSIDDVKSMLVADLKDALKERGLSTVGKKQELADRLTEAVRKDNVDATENEGSANDVQEPEPAETNDNQINKSEEKLVNQPDEIVNSDENLNKHIEEEPAQQSESITEHQENLLAEQNDEYKIEEKNIEVIASETKEAIDEGSSDMHTNENQDIIAMSEEEILKAKLQSKKESIPLLKSLSTDENIQVVTLDIDNNNVTSTGAESVAHESQPTSKSIRIDNFQRPLNAKALLVWLSDFFGCVIKDDQLWINSIKTHCYIDFDDDHTAQKAIEKVNTGSYRYPSSSTAILVAYSTNVTAREAGSSAEGSLRPAEYKDYLTNKTSTSSSSKTKNTTNSSNGNKSTNVIHPTASALFKKALTTSTPTAASSNSNNTAGSFYNKETLKRKRDALLTSESTSSVNNSNTNNNTSQEVKNEKSQSTKTLPSITWCAVAEEVYERRTRLRQRLGN